MSRTPEQMATMVARADAQLDGALGWAFRYPGDARKTELAAHWATVALALRARQALATPPENPHD